MAIVLTVVFPATITVSRTYFNPNKYLPRRLMSNTLILQIFLRLQYLIDKIVGSKQKQVVYTDRCEDLSVQMSESRMKKLK